MTYFLKVKSLGWPSERPMVLPLILSLRFLIKEKEKKRALDEVEEYAKRIPINYVDMNIHRHEVR